MLFLTLRDSRAYVKYRYIYHKGFQGVYQLFKE